ncbi:MAG: putative extracellular nuclease, partial [Limisphaerales bacterium]
FTPNGKNIWTPERYHAKLLALSAVIRTAADGKAPAIIGLCEIENEEVVRDLGKVISGGDFEYGVITFPSPDMRGIDNAILYRKELFKVSGTTFHRLHFPDEEEYTSRDILHVWGKFKKMKEPVHFFVNHWPSRRGGSEASEPRRVVAAEKLKDAVAAVQNEYEDPLIVIMGDFNDEPQDNSLRETLRASLVLSTPENHKLYNLMGPADLKDEGTYNYRGNWNMLDQFIVTGNLLSPKSKWIATDCAARQEVWMMHYNSERDDHSPSRTYGGPNYYGGFSDHLPIVLSLVRR